MIVITVVVAIVIVGLVGIRGSTNAKFQINFCILPIGCMVIVNGT